MDSVGDKLDLIQQGTRYDHYMELKEVFMLGVDVIDRMLPHLRSESDMKTRVKLEHAVELIDKRLKYLSNYDDKIHAVNREIRAVGIHRTPQLTEGAADAKPQPKDSSVIRREETQRRASDQGGAIKGGWPET